MKKIVLASIAVLLVLILVTGLSIFLHMPKTAYILTEDLYNNFKLKKELESQYNKVTSKRKAILDSLKFDLQLKYNALQSGKSKLSLKEFEILRNQYTQKQTQFDDDNNALSQEYKDQIWKRLNQYVKEYGKNKSYTYIYGVIGQGELLYAEESKNITPDLIVFVNAKYEGDIK